MKLRLSHAAAAAVLVLGVVLTGQMWGSQTPDPTSKTGARPPTSAAQQAPRKSSARVSPRSVRHRTSLAAHEASAPPDFDLSDQGETDEGETNATRDIAASARAGRMAGALTQVRKVLMESSEPEDRLLAEEVYTLVLASREQRRAPEPDAWGELVDAMDELAERVEARGHEGTAAGLERARVLSRS